MDNAFQLTGFDFAIIALLLLFTLRGLWVGCLRQVNTLVALFVGYAIAGQYNDKLFPFLRGLTENPHAVFWLSYVILFGITYVVTMLLGKALAKVVELTVAGWFDKLLGGVLGLLKACIIVVLLNMALSGVLSPENNMLRNCQSCPYVSQATDFFRNLIKDDTIRQAFLQKRPAILEKTEETETNRNVGNLEKLPKEEVRPFVPTEFPKE